METTSGPMPATAPSAARRSSARRAGSSELTNGAMLAMPSRQDASSAGVASPVGTAAVRSRTRRKPAAAASPASRSGSPACGSVSRLSRTYHAGGR